MKFLISDPCVEARGCCCCRSLTAILQPVPWDLLLAWLGKYWKTEAPNAGSLSEAGLDGGGGGGVRSRQILPSNPPFTPRWTSFAFHPASMSSPSLIQGRRNWERGVNPPCKFFIMSTEFDKNISDWSYDYPDHKNGIDFFMRHVKWPKKKTSKCAKIWFSISISTSNILPIFLKKKILK